MLDLGHCVLATLKDTYCVERLRLIRISTGYRGNSYMECWNRNIIISAGYHGNPYDEVLDIKYLLDKGT